MSQNLQRLKQMPLTRDRRPLEDDKPDEYLESDVDWCLHNHEAVNFFINNHAEIRALWNRYVHPVQSLHESAISEAIAAHFGEACPDFAEGCAACEVWLTWKNLLAGRSGINHHCISVLNEAAFWLEGALQCKRWVWDADQYVAAEYALNRIRGAIQFAAPFISSSIEDMSLDIEKDLKFTIIPNQSMDEIVNNMLDAVNDELIDADVEYPAGRDCGHNIIVNQDLLRGAIMRVLRGMDTK